MYQDIYIAASTKQKDRALALAKRLKEEAQSTITAEWLEADENPEDDGYRYGHLRAMRDLKDIDRSNIVVLLDSPEGVSFHGGRWFEMGYAFARGKHLAIIGRKENVFAHLGTIAHFTSEDSFVEFIKGFGEWGRY